MAVPIVLSPETAAVPAAAAGKMQAMEDRGQPAKVIAAALALVKRVVVVVVPERVVAALEPTLAALAASEYKALFRARQFIMAAVAVAVRIPDMLQETEVPAAAGTEARVRAARLAQQTPAAAAAGPEAAGLLAVPAAAASSSFVI